MENLNNLITISWTIQVTGDKGTDKYFLTRHQYEVSGTEDADVFCDYCESSKKVSKKHYVCIIDEEKFLIPYDNCAFEGRVREDWETDIRIQREKKPFEHPRNYNQVYKQVYGIDRIAASRRQDNGYEIAKKLGYTK